MLTNNIINVTFHKKPIKENVKPSIWQYIVQYRAIITTLIFIIALIAIYNYTNYTADSQISSAHYSNEQKVLLQVSYPKDKTSNPAMIGEKVSYNRFLHQAQNPLELDHNTISSNKPKKYAHRKTSFIRDHKLIRSIRKRPQFAPNITLKRGNSSIPLLTDSYFTQISLNLTDDVLYTDYQYQMFYKLRSESTQSCDYLSVHGLEKSGTTWMEYILSVIADQVCNKQLLSICNRSHIGHWDKHQPILPLHYNSLNVQQLYQQNEHLRFCVVSIFRDLRDRLISWSYFNDKKEDEMAQKNMLKNVRIFARELKIWFNFYGNLEIKHPLEYFNLFYEDLVLNTQFTIQRLINYIGLNDILDENDIQNITTFIDWDVLKENNINTFRSSRNKKDTTICQMNNELSAETMDQMYAKMESIGVQKEILRKFNQTCPFPTDFLQ